MPENQSSGYGKRPLWQWIVIYLIIGGAIYGLIYYFVIAKKGGYSVNYNQQGQSPTQQESSPTSTPSTTTNSNSALSDNIYKTKENPSKGKYLTDFNGMTLYVFDKDTTGVSNCYSTCETTWPPYTSGAASEKIFQQISL